MKNWKNKKMYSADVDTLEELSSNMTNGPNSYKIKKLNDAINARVGFVNVERLMNAAKHKQKFEVENNKLNLPNLWLYENQPLLRSMTMLVFNNSSVGESIQIMADKVVVWCALQNNNDIISHLDTLIITKAINDVFNNYNDIELDSRLFFIKNRLAGLNEAAKRRPPNK